MARTTIIAEYLTAGGATLTVEMTTGWLTFTTVTADCGGCRGGRRVQADDTYVTGEQAEATVQQWASQHATACRRLPSPS